MSTLSYLSLPRPAQGTMAQHSTTWVTGVILPTRKSSCLSPFLSESANRIRHDPSMLSVMHYRIIETQGIVNDLRSQWSRSQQKGPGKFPVNERILSLQLEHLQYKEAKRYRPRERLELAPPQPGEAAVQQPFHVVEPPCYETSRLRDLSDKLGDSFQTPTPNPLEENSIGNPCSLPAIMLMLLINIILFTQAYC